MTEATRLAALDVANSLKLEDGQLWQAEVLIEPIIDRAIESATAELRAKLAESEKYREMVQNEADQFGDRLIKQDERIRDLEAEVKRLRDLLDEAYRLLKHKGLLTAGHQSRLEIALATPAPSDHGIARGYPLPEVGGDVMLSSLDNFEHRCKVHLADEQRKIAPDNSLIALICDAVRLCREHGKRGYAITDYERQAMSTQESAR